MAHRFSNDNDSEPDQDAAQAPGDKQEQDDATYPTVQETQATAHTKLNKKLQVIIGRRRSLVQSP